MTKLLFITQKVDKDSDVLGVYHRWIEELAKRVEKINVICLYRGRVELPGNVRVFSLGKEKLVKMDRRRLPYGLARIIYILRFWKYVWRLRKDYDKVFVHMNPEYVVLAAKFWKLWGKKIFFWYNHPLGGLKARIAIMFSKVVFYTSPSAFAARYKKARQMPVGIDAEMFRRIPDIQKKKNSILYIGRISPIKYLDVLIDAALMLDGENIDFTLTIAGAPGKKGEYEYQERIKKQAEPLTRKGKIIFIDSVSNYKIPAIYNAYEISVNLTPLGSFDKTIIEAMACESLIVTSNNAVAEVLPQSLCFREKDVSDLARALTGALQLSDEEKRNYGSQFRAYVIGKHDLDTLVTKLIKMLG